MIWFTLLLVNVFAVFRLTELVISDKITEPIRDKIFDRYGQPHETWTYFFTCPWCVSIWIGAVAVLLTIWIPVIWFWIAFGLTLSALTGFLSQLKDRI